MSITECRLCFPLICAEWHDAAARVHAHLRKQLTRYWLTELCEAKEKAKKLWRVRREETDYRVPIVSRSSRNAAIAGGKAAREYQGIPRRRRLDAMDDREKRAKRAKKARERRAAEKAAKA